MKRAADFREIARDALKGKWWLAALTGLIASLLGGIIGSGSNFSFESNTSSSGNGVMYDLPQEFWSSFINVIAILAVILALWSIVLIVVSGATKMGYAVFNLNLVDKKEAKFSNLFSRYNRLGAGFCMNFFMALFTVLWFLLFVIPGIIKSFSYAMTPYIMAEDPNIGARAAITKSRKIMDGNKWRFFCLGLSFIGWGILCTLPVIFGIIIAASIAAVTGNVGMLLLAIPFVIPSFVGGMFLTAYQQAAYAAFYRDIIYTPEESLPEASENTEPGWYDN